LARNILATALIVLGVVIGLLVWQTFFSLLVIIAGILFSSFLEVAIGRKEGRRPRHRKE
jgi:chromate transport protein ChrA